MALEINADGVKYFGSATFETFETALQSCDWNWHLIEDEDNMTAAKESYEEMQNQMIALKKKYIEDTPTGVADRASLEKITKLHNKYAPQKYHLQ